MKKLLIILALAVFTLNAQEQVQGIKFEHCTWKEALAKAKKEKKLIMLDAYASWCGPCKWMAKNVFTQQSVGEFYNSNFVNIKIDMEKGEGVELSKKYGVTAYPTFFYIDGNGNMVHRKCGGQEAEDFIQSGKDAMDPAKQLSVLQKNFESNTTKSEAALKYFEEADKACVDLEEPVKNYLNAIPESAYTEKSNYALIDKFVNDNTHKSFVHLIDNYEKTSAALGKDVLDAKIKSVFTGNLYMAARKQDATAFKNLQADYGNKKNVPAAYLDAYAKMIWADFAKDSVVYLPAMIDYADKYLMSDAGGLNHYAWEMYENTSQKDYLTKAEAWAKRSVELEEGYENTDTYGAILLKLEKYTEAKKMLERSIELGKASGKNTGSTEKLLDEANKKQIK